MFTDSELKNDFQGAVKTMWASENPKYLDHFTVEITLPTTKKFTTVSGDPLVVKVSVTEAKGGSVSFDQDLTINGIDYRGPNVWVEKKHPAHIDFTFYLGSSLWPLDWQRKATDAAENAVRDLARVAWAEALKLLPGNVFDLIYVRNCFNEAVSAKHELESATRKTEDKRDMAIVRFLEIK